MNDNLIRDITIDGFRAFEHFEMHDLGRVNLLVGKNNCGKSSVLEAIQIASSYGDPSALWRVLEARGDVRWEKTREFRNPEVGDVTHLFYGHAIADGETFFVQLRRTRSNETLETTIKKSLPHPQGLQSPGIVFPHIHQEYLSIELNWQGKENPDKQFFPLWNGRDLHWMQAMHASLLTEDYRTPVIAIPTQALSSSQTIELFDEIALTPNESQVLNTLRTIEPTIERIATSSARFEPNARAPVGFVVKLAGVKDRVPIGSLGAGFWRMLGLALALAKSANGILLIDEIDTGLHYSVMEKMWKLIYEGAKRLNVQVFATTHSRDCVESLAAIASRDEYEEGGGDDVTIQRIERDKDTAVAFTGNRIVVAAERGIEVR